VGSDLVGSYCLSLVWVVEELYKVDNTISLFPYGKPDSDEFLILKMGSSLGDSLSQLSTYFDGLHLTRDAYPPLFVSVLHGFDSDDDLCTPNCQAQLNAIGTRISLPPLQSPYIRVGDYVGLVYFYMRFALLTTLNCLQFYVSFFA